jgi:hypothetical protein
MSKLQTITSTVILAAWAVSLSVGLVTSDFAGLTLVTPVMLIYAGYMFGESFLRRRYGENDRN